MVARSPNTIRSIVDRRDGAMAVVFAVTLAVILGCGVMALDYSFLYTNRARLQATADSAALAAAAMLPDVTAATAAAINFANRNMPSANYGNVLVAADVSTGNWNYDTRTFTAGGTPRNGVQVVTRRTTAGGNAVSPFLGGALGFQSFDVVTSAIASYLPAPEWDIVLVQDVTSSFSAEIGDAVDGDLALLQCLHDNYSGDSLIGLVTFTGVAQNNGDLISLNDGFDDAFETVEDWNYCNRPGMPPCSGTHIGAGLDAATELFEDTPGAPGVPRAMILVSDGAPNADHHAHPGMSDHDLEVWAENSADTAWAQGISLFTVFYNESMSGSQSAFMQGLVRGNGTYHETSDPGDLDELLNQICVQNLPLRLVN